MENYRGSECKDGERNSEASDGRRNNERRTRYDKASEAKKECRCTKVNNKCIIKR
jgi:hypothetical protein